MWTLVALLLIVWLGGLLSSFTFAGWIHVAPAVAILIVIASFWTRRRRRRARS